MKLVALSLAVLAASPAQLLAAPHDVIVRRVPAGGIQPQAAIDPAGTIHLIYFQGEPGQGDIQYCRSADQGASFTTPVRVNSQPQSVVAAGTIRGPQLALGRGGRVHVLWMGSKLAEPNAPDDAIPLLYSRMDDSGSFEPQRNLITEHVGLDGGGSIAADQDGCVYVVWHAPRRGTEGEPNRRVWITRSTDEGRTFPSEWLAYDRALGTCGCCGIRVFTPGDQRLFVLFRGADEIVHRDQYLLTSNDRGATFSLREISKWTAGQCVMSTTALASRDADVVAAWEGEGQIYFCPVPERPTASLQATSPAGTTRRRKHPTIAIARDGTQLVAWVERTAWNSAGRLVWQTFDDQQRPITNLERADDAVPVFGVAAALACPDGRFVLIY